MTDKFCIVPWIHLNPEPDGRVKPCCAYFDDQPQPNVRDFSLEEIWNNDRQKKIRTQFLNNETPKGCETCVRKEESSGHSLRMAMNERFGHHSEQAIKNTTADGHYEKFELIYWDFRFSNLCNFKCRMCGPSCSSSWYEDSDRTRPKLMDKNYYGRDLMPYVDQFIDIVEEIYFAGGEPLIMPEHYQILDKLIEKERFDVFLRYNTNLSTIKYKSYDLINIWKKFKQVQIFASIDGFGANAEYSRSGTDWPRVEENLKRIFETKIPVLVSCTINIFNVLHFPDFVDKLKQLNLPLKQILVSTLIYPEWYRISMLSRELKDQVRTKYENHLNTLSEEDRKIITPHYKQIYYYLDMPYNEQDELNLVKHTTKLDGYRNENFVEVIPEYKEWFNNLRSKHGF